MFEPQCWVEKSLCGASTSCPCSRNRCPLSASPERREEAFTELVWPGSGAADLDWEAASCILEEMGTAAINPGLVSSLTAKRLKAVSQVLVPLP